MTQWTIGAVLDAIAEVIPDRPMTVCGDRVSTYAESAERTRRLANFLAGRGLGAHRERAGLQNWECGQDRVALIMHNDLYPDMVIGCLKARTVPVNVNHHYTPREVAELLAPLRHDRAGALVPGDHVGAGAEERVVGVVRERAARLEPGVVVRGVAAEAAAHRRVRLSREHLRVGRGRDVGQDVRRGCRRVVR